MSKSQRPLGFRPVSACIWLRKAVLRTHAFTSRKRLVSTQVASVPEARLTIAQRFNAGINSGIGKVPKGRLSVPGIISVVPSGLDSYLHSNPALKRWAILKCPSGTGPALLNREFQPFSALSRCTSLKRGVDERLSVGACRVVPDWPGVTLSQTISLTPGFSRVIFRPSRSLAVLTAF